MSLNEIDSEKQNDSLNEIDSEKQNDIKKQTEHIFNICEKPVMNFISHFLSETTNILFKDDVPTFSEPLIIKPISDFDKDKVIVFQLKAFENINEYNINRKDDIMSVIEYTEIKEAIGFLFYAVKNVYGPIVSETLINNKPMLNNILELDDNNWVFYPKYVNNTTLKINFLKQSIENIHSLKKENKDNKPFLDNLYEEYIKINSILIKIEEDTDFLENEIKNDIEINENYTDKPVIGIIFNLINQNEIKQFLSNI